MKKFTLLIAMLFCFVAFGQKGTSTPTMEYPSKATQKVEKKQVTNQEKLPYASITDIPENIVNGMKARTASAKAKKVLASTEHRGSMTSQNARVSELLERYFSMGNQVGRLSDVFTNEEVTILRHHFAASNQSYQKTAVVNTSSSSSDLKQGVTQTVGSETRTFTATHFNGYSFSNPGNSRMPDLAYTSGPYFGIAGTPDVSLLEDATLGMGNYGWGVQVSAGNRMADDFILADDYDLTELVFYGYQSFTPTAPPTINEINVQIWDGDPALGGSSVIWGDAVTNVVSSVIWSGAYRQLESAPGNLDRAIHRITVDATGLSLPAGTYWVDWQIGGTAASGPWAPPVNILGQAVTGNAQQSIGGVWGPALDPGTGTPQQGMPIEVYGNCTSCGGGGTPVAYGVNNATAEAISWDPLAPEVLIPSGGTSPAPTFEGGGAVDPNNPGTAYAMDVGGTFYSVDVATGVYTSLGTVNQPGGETVSGMEFDPVSGTLYLLTTDITTSTLSTIDIGALTSTPIGATGMAGGIGIAIDGAGNGWSYDIVDDNFYSVDLGTGVATLVGSIGFDANFGQGMCWDSNTDQIYLSAFNNGTFVGEWRTVNTATGNSSLVGVLGGTTPGGLNQVAWSSVPDAGGGGGSGCTVGVYTDRASYDAEAAAANLEDWAGGPGGVAACDGPFSAAGNSCYAPGEILAGISVVSSNMAQADPVVYVENGNFGLANDAVGSNFFVDYTIVNFPDNNVNNFGMDIYGLIGGSTMDVRIFGTGGLITTETITDAGGTGVFFGYIASETIVSVEIEDLSGLTAELVAQVSFGECTGGGGGGGCGDITYENVSPTGNGVPAQTFPDFPDFNCQAVDDVVLLGPDAGTLCSLDITGTYTAGGLPTDPNGQVVLTIYADNAGLPGAVAFTETFPGSVDADGDGSFTLEPTGAPTVNPGQRVWVEVNVVMEFGLAGQWFWSSADDTQDDAALWQNPAGGFGVGCTEWGTFADCGVGGGLGPDLLMSADFIAVPIITYDTCDGARDISCGTSEIGDTLSATPDNAVAPDCDTPTSAPGVWYKWEDTSGLPANVVLTTCSALTDYDTKISVYTGDCAAPPLTCVAGNDDDPACPDFQSTVEFESDGSSTYYILVHGFGGQVGNFELSMSCTLIPPDNDMIVNAIDLDEVGCPFTDEDVVMPAATTENGTPTDCDITGAAGVWYKFTPEGDGFITGTIATPGPGVGSTNLAVNNGPLAGDYNPVAASFGGAIPLNPLTEDAVVVIDDGTSGDPNDACDPVLNGADLNGKIAVLRRGSCEFGFKALAAQNEGAIAVVVVNNQPGDPIVMGGGAVGDQVTIPVVMISDVEGEPIITELLAANTVNMTLFGTLPDVSSVTFYTAPDETSTEDELVLVDWWQNQCLPSDTATIPVVANQAYYCFVVNTGAVSDIIFDNCQLSVDSNEIEGFVFYPNPANDRLNLTSIDYIDNVALYNILGQKVMDFDVNATTTQVDVSRLSVGTYIMKVTSNGQTGTYKVIKK
jgi:hypothetical protein